MKSAFTFLLLLLILGSTPLFSQLHYKWSQSIGSKQSDFVGNMLADEAGNLYQMANFADTVDLDPGSGIDLLNPITYTVALIKSDPEGNFIWSGRFFSNGAVGGHMTEIKDGRIRMSFRFTGNFIYEFNGQRLIDHQVNGSFGCLLTLSLDGEVLNVVYWPRKTTWFVENSHMLADGRTLIQGRFEDSLQIPGEPTLVSHGADDAFVILLDENDEVIWAHAYGTAGEDDEGTMSVYQETTCYFVITFEETLTLSALSGDIVFPASGNEQSAIVAVNLQGQVTNAFQVSASQDAEISALAIDKEGNLYLGGYFEGTINFAHASQAPEIHTSVNADDGYIARYRPNGHLDWVNVYPGENYSFLNTLTIARDNELYASGGFSGNTDLDPGPGSMLIVTDDETEIFIAKIQPDGTQSYVYHFQGNDIEGITSLLVSETRSEVLVSGFYYVTLDCDHSVNEAILESNGGTDIFRIAFDEDIVLATNNAVPDAEVLFYPNPATDAILVKSDQEIVSISIHTLDGQLVRTQYPTNAYEDEVDLRGLAPAVYCVNVFGKNTVTTGRIMKLEE